MVWQAKSSHDQTRDLYVQPYSRRAQAGCKSCKSAPLRGRPAPLVTARRLSKPAGPPPRLFIAADTGAGAASARTGRARYFLTPPVPLENGDEPDRWSSSAPRAPVPVEQQGRIWRACSCSVARWSGCPATRPQARPIRQPRPTCRCDRRPVSAPLPKVCRSAFRWLT